MSTLNTRTYSAINRFLIDIIIVGFITTFVIIAGMAVYHAFFWVITNAFSAALIFIPSATYINAVYVYAAINPVHSLLALITVFFFNSLFMLAIGAEFLSFTFLVIYVGAIAILFLFVIILLDIKSLTAEQRRPLKPAVRQLTWVTYGAAVSTVFILYDAFTQVVERGQIIQLLSEPSSVSALVKYVTEEFRDIAIFSNLLYGYYAILFRLMSLLLLTAILGAIVLATSTTDEPIVAQLSNIPVKIKKEGTHSF